MGLADIVAKAKTTRYMVSRIPLDRGGYTKSGRYYGTGEKLWDVWDTLENVNLTVRAKDKKTARLLACVDPRKWGGWK